MINAVSEKTTRSVALVTYQLSYQIMCPFEGYPSGNRAECMDATQIQERTDETTQGE